MTDTSLSDTLTVRALLERIAVEKQWSKEDVESDLAILAKNRLVYVKDLRSLSKESWTQIELVPLVKDLLRAAINPTKGDLVANNNQEEEDKKDKKKNKKKNKKEFKSTSTLGTPVVPTILTKPSAITTNQLAEDTSRLSLDTSEDHLTVRNTIRNGGSFGVPVDDDDDDDDDYIISPTTGMRRRKVSFFSEAALENSSNITDDDVEKKKGKKEKKKDKKKKKKEMKNAENAEGAEITEN